MTDRYIRRPELIQMTGLSSTTLWRLEKAGDLPARVKLSANTVGWSLNSIQNWLESRQPVDDVA